MVSIDITNSTSIKRIAYDHLRQILSVTYTTDKTYDYLNVPAHKFDELKSVIIDQGSVGGFVSQHIKPVYKYTDRLVHLARVYQFADYKNKPRTGDWFLRNIKQNDNRRKQLDDKRKQTIDRHKPIKG